MLQALRVYLKTESMKGLEIYFQERFAAICVSEKGGDALEVNVALKKAVKKKKHPLLIRSRFWIDSFVLGSRASLREHAADFWGEERAQKKKFGKAYDDEGGEILSLRQLMVDVN